MKNPPNPTSPVVSTVMLELAASGAMAAQQIPCGTHPWASELLQHRLQASLPSPIRDPVGSGPSLGRWWCEPTTR